MLDKLLNNDQQNMTLTKKSIRDEEEVTEVRHFTERPVISPTVKISWFVEKAYQANFYYTVRHNYPAVERICNEIISISQKSFYNKMIAEEIFSVVLSTEWTDVYDSSLQQILGHYSLCAFIFDVTDRSRSVYQGICPILYALYLKWRFAVDLEKTSTVIDCMNEIQEHKCLCDKKVNNGRLAVQVYI